MCASAGKLEWASHNLSTIFVQRRNLLSPSFLRMVADVVRFGREAPKVRGSEQAGRAEVVPGWQRILQPHSGRPACTLCIPPTRLLAWPLPLPPAAASLRCWSRSRLTCTAI